MGVPGLYKCLLKRYPLIQHDIVNLPSFDYFYIDLNGVIHQMSHSTDELRRTRVEEEIFHDICDYIDSLVKVVNPQSVLFLCVDGAAPLAKIVQQRSRRYQVKSSDPNKISESLLEDDRKTKHFEIQHFNRNCITPGTQFMEDLHQYLIKFITEKSSYDSSWKSIKIVYSGYNIPGEGEHKIMDFVRCLRNDPSFNPKSTHCFHGLDADLILLGLVTHLKSVAILRENQSFAGKIHLGCEMRVLYISILRDYIELEFAHLEDQLPFEYNFDRLLNDWILLACLIGNDFIPNIPFVYIRSGGLFLIWDVYSKVLPTLNDYLTTDDKLNIDEFIKFLKALSTYESSHLTSIEFKFKKSGSRKDDPTIYDKHFNRMFNKSDVMLNEKNIDSKYKTAKIKPVIINELSSSSSDSFDLAPLSDDDSTQRTMGNFSKLKISNSDSNLNIFKTAYYTMKFHMDYDDEEDLKKVCYDFMSTVAWILQYYSTGLRDWRFVYPHHYAPFVSDVAKFCPDTYRMSHLRTEPIDAFTQLLCVQPPTSCYLLPEIYRPLITETDSPIIDLFPADFETDLNGKKYEFEKDRVISCVKQLPADKITSIEKIRNTIGSIHLWNEEKHYWIKANKHGQFDLSNLITRILSDRVKNGDDYFIVIVELDDPNARNMDENDDISLYEMYSKYVNKLIYFDFPYSRLGILREIILDEGFLTKKNGVKSQVAYEDFTNSTKDIFNNQRSRLEEYYLNHGIKLNDKKMIVLFRIHDLDGFKYIPLNQTQGILRPQWSKVGEYYPSHVVVCQGMGGLNKYCYSSKPVLSDNIFEPKSSWISVNENLFQNVVKLSHFKQAGVYRGVFKSTVPLKLKLTAYNRPLYSNYMTIRTLANFLNINPLTLNLFLTKINVTLTDSWTVVNVGLCLFNKKDELELPGFSLCYKSHYLISVEVRDMMVNYMKKFPSLFVYVEKIRIKYSNENAPFKSGLRDNNFVELTGCDFEQVLELLKLQPSFCMQKYNSGSISMDNKSVEELNQLIKNCKHSLTHSELECVYPSNLHYPYKPKLSYYYDSTPLPVRLLDRVVITAGVPGIPLGADGFVVAVNSRTIINPRVTFNPTSNVVHIYVEVVFTKLHRFTSKFSGRIPNSCIIPYDWTFNISRYENSTFVPSMWAPYYNNKFINYNEIISENFSPKTINVTVRPNKKP